MYKEVPCYGPDGIIEAFRLVEVPAGPIDMEQPLESTSENDEMLNKPVVQAELTLENLQVRQKTIEDSDVVGDVSEEDLASSTGSSSIDQTETEELDSQEEEMNVKSSKPKDRVHLAFSTLDAFDFDNELRTLDGHYLVNVDGRYVFDKNDIKKFLHDGKAHRLHFRDMPNKVNRIQRKEVCFKPLYKTLKNIQVRSGPGSKFAAAGVVKAQEQIIVVQEGLLECDLGLVREWMQLHLPARLFYDFGKSKAPTLEEFINDKWVVYGEDLLAFFAEKIYRFDEAKIAIFRKAVAAASRKVKVVYFENGVEKTGWISKRKNSGPLISRIYGKSAPQVVISGVRTEIRDSDFANPQACDGTFVPDAMKFFNEHTKTTMIKYYNFKGEAKERTETHHCHPTMAFFKSLARSEIAAIIGSKKSRFAIDWQSEFRSDRFRGLEKETVIVDGKKRMHTGYHVASDEITVTFQVKRDAIEFFNADFADTAFSTACIEWEASYENLQPVDASLCPEHRIYKSGIARRSEVGISFINV